RGTRGVGGRGDPAGRLADRQSRRRSAGSAAGTPESGAYVRPRHFPWAELLRRTFEIDILACPDCGGRLRLVATIEDHAVIEKILRTSVCRSIRRPPRRRAPPTGYRPGPTRRPGPAS